MANRKKIEFVTQDAWLIAQSALANSAIQCVNAEVELVAAQRDRNTALQALADAGKRLDFARDALAAANRDHGVAIQKLHETHGAE